MGYSRWGDNDSWAPYVSVAERKKKAEQHISSLAKKGKHVNPIKIEGRKIAKTFWGKAWCENLEKYSDYINRLPRGRTYVRNGSVIDLQVAEGRINAKVMGSSLYHVSISITPMIKEKWKTLIKACTGKIDSLIELLHGKFSKAVMEIITTAENGLFPKPKEISMKCSCPDSAGMCKHIAAVLYGVGASLDIKPDWLFILRHVDHLDLIAAAGSEGTLIPQQTGSELEDSELSTLFNIEMDDKIPAKKKKNVTKKSEASAAIVKKPAKKRSGILPETSAKTKEAPKIKKKNVVKKTAAAKKKAPLETTKGITAKNTSKIKQKKQAKAVMKHDR